MIRSASQQETGSRLEARELPESHYILSQIFDSKDSALAKYSRLVVGEKSLFALIKHELIVLLFGSIPGILGLFLRKYFYRLLFKNIGKGVVFGRNITIRYANNIEIGNNVILDDYCLIDGRGAGDEKLKIGNDVIIGRGAVLIAKVGPLHIGAHCLVGQSTTITSHGGVFVGEWVGFAAGCKVSGGLFDLKPSNDDSMPPYRRYTKGPIKIDGHCVLAYGAIVLDGVHIGERSMIGPGTVVLQDLPPNAIVSPRPGVVMRNAARDPHVS